MYDRCVDNAGGGPDAVSIPWLLLDAGARLMAGDLVSGNDAVACLEV